MKNKYDLSIIIPVYNGAEHISMCLDSILRQQDIEKFQIIIVNDGSTDNTISVVQKYVLKHPNITLINQENAGCPSPEISG